jgi:outer membrane protein assembly factor BamE (lipoprotein component of BamABCDE complex)
MRKSGAVRSFTRAGACALVLALTACAARIDARGNLPDADSLAQMKPGKTTREQVLQALGSPSSVAMFDEETWLYMSQRTETVAFFSPKVTERKVVIVQFDKRGVLSDVKTMGLDAARDVEPVDRVTPTAGNELTILDQIVGNFGRFGKERGKTPGSGDSGY